MDTPTNMLLFVATYDDDATAESDFEVLKHAQAEEDFVIMGAVVMDRDDDGEVHVKSHHSGVVGGAATGGGVVGLVVGLFSPPLLLATAVGAGIGAGIGALLKRHAESELSVELEDALPPGSSAIVAIVEDTYLDRIDHALAKSSKKINKAIDSGDYDELQEELDKAEERVGDAIES